MTSDLNTLSLVRLEWANIAEFVACILILIYLIFLLPKLKPAKAALVTFLVFLSLAIISQYFLILGDSWLPLDYAQILLLSGYFLFTIKSYRSTYSAEESVRPQTESAKQDTGTPDITSVPDGPSDNTIEITRLGRYQIQKELGKGAMGLVFLGNDPKINRTVAIKTLALSEEFEEDEIESAKERFFREAETAGRLTHPNIVTIYDAGEEHDLAYIAMEFLNGHDLYRYTKRNRLLPISSALQITILAADALNYAHENNVIHRDIKPANVMYLPDQATVKLTDFGIARIMDVSKTKTGIVLGTPSYMSPEQLTGKKNIDGRSDLFSLGVMLYQLLCGQLPFEGDSMATLMYKIANDTHPDISTIRPEIAQNGDCVVPIINKVLEKVPEKRYQTGAALAADLRNCLKNIKNKKK